MKILLIDTTTSFVTVSIIDDDKILYCFHEQILTDMSSKIIPIIDEAFKKVGFDLKSIDKIMVCNGPGSFTGIRVGVTVAKTMAWALKKDIIPISSLELIASTSTNKKYTVPMIDARRGNVFAGIYDSNINNTEKDKLINLEKLTQKLDSNYEIISYDDIKYSIKPNIDVLKIANKHKNDKSINPHNLNPNYLKLTEAEENKNQNDKKL